MNMQQMSPRGFSMLPPVVKNLLIINGLVFLAQLTVENVFRIDLTRLLGMHYFGSSLFNPIQLVTYMFLHGNFTHVFFNMFALWMFGYTLENVWGPKRFLTYYFVTGIGAALIHMGVMWLGIHGVQNDIAAVMAAPSPEAFTAFVQDHYPNYYGQVRSFIENWRQSPNDIGHINQAGSYMNDLLNIQMNVPTVGASGAVFGILLAFGMMFPNAMIYLYFFFPIKAK
ncbi:MAG: rhomboid family intramembrane serine protease, partial [Lentimicrobiaceae bacterium]|nr:rhomboid family intramembrane serine protease [Lentimicrobiaceae bacterium]